MKAIATTTLGIAAAAIFAAPLAATAHTVHAGLDGYQETPQSISTSGSGDFRAKVRDKDGAIEWELTYDGLQGNVLQAHIHFGQAHTSGGISAFLCTNLGNSPGTQACPQSGTISGVITAENVIGPAGQQLAPGEIAELIAAILSGAAYVNVHSSLVPSGEIRGQIR